jgi:hypothetical protein
VVRDITPDKARRLDVSSANERLSTATTAGRVGVWDWDVPNNVLVWDELMYQLYGLHEADFGGAYEAWAVAIHPEDKAATEGEIQAALRGEREYAPRFRVIWPDGSIHHLKAASRTTYDAEGRPLRMIGVNYTTASTAPRRRCCKRSTTSSTTPSWRPIGSRSSRRSSASMSCSRTSSISSRSAPKARAWSSS